MNAIYDKNKNYAKEMQNQMDAGASDAAIQKLLDGRNAKMQGDPGYYAPKGISTNDAISDAARSYIDSYQNKSSKSNLGKAGGEEAQGFSYGDAPRYTSKYKDQIETLTDRLLNGSYAEFTGGDQYAALQDRYTENGQRAMQDTVGQVSARTGGLASSYAGTAGQQTYGNYMDQLQQAAMEMYQVDYNKKAQQVQLLQGMDNGEYGRYQDRLGQYNNDRNFDYQAGRDGLGDSRYDQSYSDGRGDVAYERLRQNAEDMAQYGDFSGYQKLGYSQEQIAQKSKAYAQAQQPRGKASSSGGGGSSGGGAQNYDGLFEAARKSGNFTSFIANNYKKYGFSSATGLKNEYETWVAKSGLNENAFKASASSIVAQLTSGKEKEATNNVDRIWKSLSVTQREEIQALMDRYGLIYDTEE